LGDLKSLNKYLWRYRGRLALGVIFVLLSNVFAVIQPKMISQALDLVLQDVKTVDLATGFAVRDQIIQNLTYNLLTYGILVISFALLMGLFMYFTRQTIIVVSRLIEYDLRRDIYDHYSTLSQNFYRKSRVGDLMNRIMEDVSKVRMYLGPAILYTINLTTLAVLVIGAMVSVSPTLSLYTLIPLPFLSLSIYYVSSIVHRRSTLIQQQLSKLTSLAQETYSGIRVVKSFVKSDQVGDYFTENCEEYKNKYMNLVQVNAFFHPLMMLIVGISLIAVIYFGGLQIDNGTISAGVLVEFIIYVNMLTWPVTSMGWIVSIVQQAAASQRRIDEFFDQKPSIINGTISDSELKHSIEFKNVTFVYPDTGIRALDNVSFTIRKGDKIAIIGKTGSGKTTIAELILRTFDPYRGQVLVDGQDLRELDLVQWRHSIGYVPQDNFLFSDTIQNNIRFGRDEATMEEIETAAIKSMIHDEITQLPEEYQTRVGERGVSLSGGQKQRTSIARALIKDPTIIIMDDALSAVDATTEQEITQSLESELKGKTVINITHRLNPNINYHKIIIMQKGRIAAVANHETLYETNSYYRHIIDHASLESI